MEQRFTKGKWRFSRYGELEAHDNGKMVDTIMFVPQDEQLIEDDTTLIVINNIQDKRLIQAAPEMYTLLESILMMPVTGKHTEYEEGNTGNSLHSRYWACSLLRLLGLKVTFP